MCTGVDRLASNALIAGLLPPAARRATTTIGPAFQRSPLLAGLVGLVSGLASFEVTAAALRTFVTDETVGVPPRAFTRNLGGLRPNDVVGYVVFEVVVTVGFVLLVVPGSYLRVSLSVWFVVVAVEDVDFVRAFGERWSLGTGHRWRLLLLGLIVMALAGVFYGVTFAATFLASPWVALAVVAAFGALVSVFSLATSAWTDGLLVADKVEDGASSSAI